MYLMYVFQDGHHFNTTLTTTTLDLNRNDGFIYMEARMNHHCIGSAPCRTNLDAVYVWMLLLRFLAVQEINDHTVWTCFWVENASH